MAYKNFGENLRPTGGREVFFPNFLRLIRLVEKRMYEKYIFGRGFQESH
jgi:hypothetical protein